MLQEFFFSRDDPRLLAMVRIGTGGVLLVDALRHWPFAVELYSTAGPALPVFLSSAFHAPIPTPLTAVLMHTTLLFALAALAVGWQTRCSALLSFVLFAWLGPLDGPGTFAKDSVIGLHLLLILAVANCGAAWSVDATVQQTEPKIAIWPRRLLQLLLCSVYLGAAFTKLRSPTFMNGDLLIFSLLDDQWGGGRFGMWLSTRPRLPMLLSLATVLFELLFPFLVWVPRCRRPMLVAAVVFHGVMGAAMTLGMFTPLMIVALGVFLNADDLQLLRIRQSEMTSKVAHVPRKRSVISFAWHIAAATVAIALGAVIQWRADWYGDFGRHEAVPLAEISRAEFDTMLAQQLPPFEDYVHKIELGSRFSGHQVFGESFRFRRGMRAYVLVQFMHPHLPLELEGLLIAPDGREVARFTHRVEASHGYAVNGFELTDDLPAGPYRIILQADGYAIAQRRIEIAD